MSKEGDWPTLFDPATLVRKGLCPVMAVQGQEETAAQSHSLYFEQHGTGKDKILFIMGLNNSSFAWGYQVKHFAKTHSVLVFDNRGVGNSDTPKGPYTTSRMADDAVALLDYIGWTNGRDLHVVGISLGGMIAQELALKIPQRILSLSLVVTKAGTAGFFANLAPLSGITGLIGITLTGSDERRAELVLPMLYPNEWLDAPSEITNDGRTNREVAKANLMHRMSIQRKQPLAGSMAQTSAVTSHNVTPEKLSQISKTIPKVFIVTGDVDNLVKPVNSAWLHLHMPEAEYQVWEGVGHGIVGQVPKRFNETLERIITEGRERGTKAPWV